MSVILMSLSETEMFPKPPDFCILHESGLVKGGKAKEYMPIYSLLPLFFFWPVSSPSLLPVDALLRWYIRVFFVFVLFLE